MKKTFIFVCQSGELEIQSMLLVASFVKFNQEHDYKLCAAVPGPESVWGRLSDSTVNFMNRNNVDLVPIENKININYPIGNKISCLCADTGPGTTVFLDSDMLCMSPVGNIFDEGFEFMARVAGGYNLKMSDGDWRETYALLDMNVPEERMRSTIKDEDMPRYFNAGLIAVANRSDFGPVWLHCCKVIDSCEKIPDKRPFLDQIALPVAVEKLNLTYKCLPDKYNYPLKAKSDFKRDQPVLVHYHSPWKLFEHRETHALCKELARENEEIRLAVSSSKRWKLALKNFLYVSIFKKTMKYFERRTIESKG